MTYIIGEAGTAHAGTNRQHTLGKALSLVDDANVAGADAVKFQLFVSNEKLFCPLSGDEGRWKRWNDTLLHFEDWEEIKDFCVHRGIDLILSAFQKTGVEWVNELGITHKVASRAAKDYPYEMANGPFIISSGMETPHYTETPAHKTYHWLQCVSEYPAPLKECWWSQCMGISDHSGTPWPGLDAISKGADYVEVHFCPEGFDPGNDKPVCLTTDELKLLCDFNKALNA